MRPNLKSLTRSLKHRNYRLYFLGQSISLVGTWMQQIAMSWLVYQMTGSSFKLGLVLFCGQIPILFLSPLAGVYVDHWNRHKMLMLTQGLSMAQAFLLAFLGLTGHIEVWQVMILSLFLGMINAFDTPGRQAFLSDLIERRSDLANAIALNSSMMNGARLLGPSIAGALLAATNPSVCFLVNGFSYFAVLAALYAMQFARRDKPRHHKRLREGLSEGFFYALRFLPIRVILLTVCLMSLAGSAYSVLLPEFAVHVLHGGPGTLGLLTTATGLGALCGTVSLASRGSVVGISKWIWSGLFLMGGCLTAMAWSQALWLALLVLAAYGFGSMTQMAASNTLLQTIVDEDKRGRIMSFFTTALLGMAPLGSVMTGYIAETFGLVTAFMLSGGLCLLAGAIFFTALPAMRPLIRPIYVRLNLLPALTAGIENASELGLMTKE